jgi:hypothetical protein
VLAERALKLIYYGMPAADWFKYILYLAVPCANRYLVLIVFIEELLNIQYFLFSLLVCTRINRKVVQCVGKPHTVVHVRSMDFPNLVHTFVAIVLVYLFIYSYDLIEEA